MKKIADAAGHALKWSQVGARRHELRSEDEIVATLAFRSVFGTLATAEGADGCFTFKRIGFWRSRANIRECDSDADVAHFTNNTWASGGTLEFPDGARYKGTTSFWKTRLEWKSEGEESLVSFHYGGVFMKKANVEIAPAARDDPHLHSLVTFGWYLAIMLSNDAAAAAIVTTG
jgi:hypothetical protein